MKLYSLDTTMPEPQKTISHHTKKSIHRIKEISMFIITLVISWLVWIIGINFTFFKMTVNDYINPQKAIELPLVKNNIIVPKKYQIKQIAYNDIQQTTTEILQTQRRSLPLVFNYLPPDNRIIIESKWIDSPLIDIIWYTPEKIQQWDFHEELERWVVKYPNMPNPNESWNILLFWHTSDYRRNHNPFWEIFSKIPKLEKWQIIKLVRRGQLYEYEVTEKKVVKPHDVSKLYAKRTQDQWITLMWCYPVWTADSRILVFAKQRKRNTKNFLTYVSPIDK